MSHAWHSHSRRRSRRTWQASASSPWSHPEGWTHTEHHQVPILKKLSDVPWTHLRWFRHSGRPTENNSGEYVLGSKLTLETDHRPLVLLLNSTELCKMPPRIQRFLLRLMIFAPLVQYVPGKQQTTADALSHAPVESPSCIRGWSVHRRSRSVREPGSEHPPSD